MKYARALVLALALGTSAALTFSSDAEEAQYHRALGAHTAPHPNTAPGHSGCVITPTDTKTTASTAAHLNEPCYVHDATCEGYQVCCVKKDTCVGKGGTVSSNKKYYHGQCTGPKAGVNPNTQADWTDKALPDGCAKQGECNEVLLEYMQNGKTKLASDKATIATELTTAFMTKSSSNKCQTKCKDKDGAGTGTAAVSTADCGTGFVYDTDSADKFCKGTACDPANEAHDKLFCCKGATCADKDGTGTGTAAVSDADCGTGYIAKASTKWRGIDGTSNKCMGATCLVGDKGKMDQPTCCSKQDTCESSSSYDSAVTDELCGEGLAYDVSKAKKYCAGTSCVAGSGASKTMTTADIATCCSTTEVVAAAKKAADDAAAAAAKKPAADDKAPASTSAAVKASSLAMAAAAAAAILV